MSLVVSNDIACSLYRGTLEGAEWVGLLQKLAALQVTVRIEDVPAFVRAAGEAGWSAVDSGARVTTEDGVDKEAVILLRIPVIAGLVSSTAAT